MIKLYREEKSQLADTIEAEFREMVLGYDRVIVEPAKALTMFEGLALPVITNNERVVSGEEIQPYIKALEKLMNHWQLYQGDMCMPVAGLMSNRNAAEVAAAAATVLDGFKTCGCHLNNPNMQLSLSALVVIPELRLSDLGLVDVTHFEFIPVLEV